MRISDWSSDVCSSDLNQTCHVKKATVYWIQSQTKRDQSVAQNLFARITPESSPSLPDLAYRVLREAILGSTVRPGQPLRQEDIAQQLGISRLPVREALRRLEVEGLVVLRPCRGYVVDSVGRGEFEDVFDLRAMLEEKAGLLATKARRQEIGRAHV